MASSDVSGAILVEGLSDKVFVMKFTCPRISYATVAAYRNGQKKLAALLLDFWTRTSEQVDVLSRMHHKNLVTLVGYCQERSKCLTTNTCTMIPYLITYMAAQ